MFRRRCLSYSKNRLLERQSKVVGKKKDDGDDTGHFIKLGFVAFGVYALALRSMIKQSEEPKYHEGEDEWDEGDDRDK
jgi:hypothetical protein